MKIILDKIFKKDKEEDNIYFIIVDFSDEAYDKSINHWSLKKIYHIQGDSIVNVEDYTEPMIKMYKRMHIPIIDVTVGQMIPKSYHKVNVIKNTLGRIMLGGENL